MRAIIKCALRGTHGFAIIWSNRDYDSANAETKFYITFNQRHTAPSVDSESYPTAKWAKEYAHSWLLDQPKKVQPAGFQFINANPRSIDGESNDCVVRALSLAFNKPYCEVHELCAKIGRAKGRGMRSSQIELAIQELSNNGIAKLARPYRAQTFTTFARDNKKGNYVIIKRGHAVAMIDGVFHDAGSIGEPRAIVKSFYKVN
jgi:hypothetical protein